ncbi:MAG: hypothetical protein ACK5LV_04110 [Lachnospirales bacterium]
MWLNKFVLNKLKRKDDLERILIVGVNETVSKIKNIIKFSKEYQSNFMIVVNDDKNKKRYDDKFFENC